MPNALTPFAPEIFLDLLAFPATVEERDLVEYAHSVNQEADAPGCPVTIKTGLRTDPAQSQRDLAAS